MKRFLSILFIIFFFTEGLAQVCQPFGTNFMPKQAGIIMPPLQPKKVGESVFPSPMPLLFYMIKDSVIGIDIAGNQFQDTVVFESYKLDSILNIPPGTQIPLSSCSQPNCFYNPAQTEWGCVSYSGTFTQAGTYNITFLFKTTGYIVVDATYPQAVLSTLALQGISPGDTIRPENAPNIFSFLNQYLGTVPYVGQQVVEKNSASISKLRNAGLNLEKRNSIYFIVNKSSSYKQISVKLYSLLGEKVFSTTKTLAPNQKLAIPKAPSGGIYFLSVKPKGNNEILIKLALD